MNERQTFRGASDLPSNSVELRGVVPVERFDVAGESIDLLPQELVQGVDELGHLGGAVGDAGAFLGIHVVVDGLDKSVDFVFDLFLGFHSSHWDVEDGGVGKRGADADGEQVLEGVGEDRGEEEGKADCRCKCVD